MIFTDRFVYVHEPKTGGTFVTSMLFRLYGLRWTRWTHLRNALFGRVRCRHPRYGALVHDSNKHGGCNEIPPPQRGKKVLATVRNPFDLYVSQYEFGWWRRAEFLRHYEALPRFREEYPNFPDLSFAEYVQLSNAALRPLSGGVRGVSDEGPGLITEQFLNSTSATRARRSSGCARALTPTRKTRRPTCTNSTSSVQTNSTAASTTSSSKRVTKPWTCPSSSAKEKSSRAAAGGARRSGGKTTTRPS